MTEGLRVNPHPLVYRLRERQAARTHTQIRLETKAVNHRQIPLDRDEGGARLRHALCITHNTLTHLTDETTTTTQHFFAGRHQIGRRLNLDLVEWLHQPRGG